LALISLHSRWLGNQSSTTRTTQQIKHTSQQAENKQLHTAGADGAATGASGVDEGCDRVTLLTAPPAFDAIYSSFNINPLSSRSKVSTGTSRQHS